MTNESMVQLGCAHSFCGDCIIGQIKSSRKPTSECAMCRATISECRSTSKKLLQKNIIKYCLKNKKQKIKQKYKKWVSRDSFFISSFSYFFYMILIYHYHIK